MLLKSLSNKKKKFDERLKKEDAKLDIFCFFKKVNDRTKYHFDWKIRAEVISLQKYRIFDVKIG